MEPGRALIDRAKNKGKNGIKILAAKYAAQIWVREYVWSGIEYWRERYATRNGPNIEVLQVYQKDKYAYMVDADKQYFTNPLLDMDVHGPILLTLLENKEEVIADEITAGAMSDT